MARMAELLLNVAAISHRSTVNGPGVRAVVWVQGCTIGCPGCFNPQTHGHEERRLWDPVQLAEELCSIADLDGVTLSGGEPFEQAAACAQFAEMIARTARSLMVFSGYPYKLLAGSPHPEVQRLLSSIDLLVAGPYVRGRAIPPENWRASDNQELLVLTPKGQQALNRHQIDGPCVELTVDGKGISYSGFPDSEDLVWLSKL
jgi:anaerobic ribonucleoside-triphosphate reductase activating protein